MTPLLRNPALLRQLRCATVSCITSPVALANPNPFRTAHASCSIWEDPPSLAAPWSRCCRHGGKKRVALLENSGHTRPNFRVSAF
jgi:hypothetical protein